MTPKQQNHTPIKKMGDFDNVCMVVELASKCSYYGIHNLAVGRQEFFARDKIVMGRLVGAATITPPDHRENNQADSEVAKLVSSGSNGNQGLASGSERGVGTQGCLLSAGILCSGLALALTVGYLSDAEGGKRAFCGGELGLGRRLAQ